MEITINKKQEAMNLNFEIKATANTLGTALVEYCRLLKKMRDSKLYEELGFENFEEYAAEEHGIQKRQAYTYISAYENLQPKLMADNADIGITKLALLAKVSAVDREEFIEKNDIKKISVSELEEIIKEKNGLSEQLSLLKNENNAIEKIKDESISEILNLQNEIKNLKAAQSNVVEATVVPADIEKIKAEVAEEMKKSHDEEIKKIKESENQKYKKELENAIDKAEKEITSKTQEEIKKQVAATTATLEIEKAKASELEKRLALAGNSDKTKFLIYFEEMQRNVNTALDVLKNI
ncbi:MAG: hypothetical protein RR052_01070, partial [Oscillospiraceae bacterium]